MAVREGFEPSLGLTLRLISSQVHSTGLCQLLCYVSNNSVLRSNITQSTHKSTHRDDICYKVEELFLPKLFLLADNL